MQIISILIVLFCGIASGIAALAYGLSSHLGCAAAVVSEALLIWAVSAVAIRDYSSKWPSKLGNIFDESLRLVVSINLALVWVLGGIAWALKHGMKFDRPTLVYFAGITLGVIIATAHEHHRRRERDAQQGNDQTRRHN